MVSESRSLGLGKGGVVSDSWPSIAGGDSEAEGWGIFGTLDKRDTVYNNFYGGWVKTNYNSYYY